MSYSELLNSDTVVVRVDRVIDELYGEIVNTTDIVKYATKITDYIEIFEAIRYIGEWGDNMDKSLLHEVLADVYSKLIKARRFRNAEIYTDEHRLCLAFTFECYGMIKALLILGLISKDRYILLDKAIDTYDLSIIEEYMYKLSK